MIKERNEINDSEGKDAAPLQMDWMKFRHRCHAMAPQEPCHDEVFQPCLQRDKGGEVDPMHAAPLLVHFSK
jgi:hypothetical protein